MLYLLLYIPLVCLNDSVCFLRYFADQQGIKVIDQFINDYVEISHAFRPLEKNHKYMFYTTERTNVFQYKIKEKIVASVYLEKNTFYDKIKKNGKYYPISRDTIGIYSLYISKNYRRQGYAKKILHKAIEEMKTHYNIKDCDLVLHLDPKDPDMEIAFYLYYTLNFKKGAFSKIGPHDFKYEFSNIYKLNDSLEVIDNLEKYDNGEIFFFMTCPLNEFKEIKVTEEERKSIKEHAHKLKKKLHENKMMKLENEKKDL